MEDKKDFLKELNKVSFSNPDEISGNNSNFENTIDVKKINQIKRMERSIILDDLSPKKTIDYKPIIVNNNNSNENNSNANITVDSNRNSYDTFSENLNRDIGNRDQKIMKHANFYHDFSEYKVNVTDVIPLYFKKEKFAQENGIDNNKYL